MSKTGRWVLILLLTCGLASASARAVSAQDSWEQYSDLFRRAQESYNAGSYDEAVELAERARLALKEGPFPEVDNRYSLYSPLSLVARAYHAKGDYPRAEAAFKRLITLIENAPDGGDRLPAARAYNEIAVVYEAQGDYARALQSRERGNEIIERHLTRRLTPDLKETSPPTDIFDALIWGPLKKQAAHDTAGTTEGSRLDLFESVSGETDAMVSLHVRHMPHELQAARLAVTNILRRKGRSLDSAAAQVNVVRRYGTPDDQKLIEQLAGAYTRLARLSNEDSQTIYVPDIRKLYDGKKLERIIDRSMRSDSDKDRLISKARDEIDELEMALGRRAAELRAPEPVVSLDAVRLAVPADAALVEIFSYQPFNPKARLELISIGRQQDDYHPRRSKTGDLLPSTEPRGYGEARYIAYVLRRDEEAPAWVELGDGASIDEAVRRLRAALADPRRADVKETARALDERVMRPVRKLLGPTRRVFLAPDGALHLIPFAALVDEENRYLVENYSITYLTTGRDLLHLQVGRESRGEPKVFADPLFEGAAGVHPRIVSKQPAPPFGTPPANSIYVDLKTLNYRPLPGTAAEAEALGKLLAGATVFTQERATEAALKSVRGPRLLHIATHGFFLVEQAEGEWSGRRPWSAVFGFGINTLTRMREPLLRSGLIMAGVRQRSSRADEDGVLTALEVAGLDLWGTQLIMLSACETGLGELMVGEGVYGLRRALVLAGSQTQIMSLWKVSDTGTRALVVAYYTLIQQGTGRGEAMRQVQLAMLRGTLRPSGGRVSGEQKGERETTELRGETPATDYRHPYYWASFITSGDWRNLAGQER